MNKLLELRKQNGYTQAYLAQKLKIAPNTYNQYENNKRQIPDEIKIALANIFNVSVDYLIGRENTPYYYIPDTLQDTQIAFTNGLQDLDEEELRQVADFVDFLKNKRK